MEALELAEQLLLAGKRSVDVNKAVLAKFGVTYTTNQMAVVRKKLEEKVGYRVLPTTSTGLSPQDRKVRQELLNTLATKDLSIRAIQEEIQKQLGGGKIAPSMVYEARKKQHERKRYLHAYWKL